MYCPILRVIEKIFSALRIASPHHLTLEICLLLSHTIPLVLPKQFKYIYFNSYKVQQMR